MKKLLLTTVTFLSLLGLFAQSIPLGMKYQAVARNDMGEVLANQQLFIKISLKSPGENYYYSEEHNITTNDFGLFNLIIGDGVILDGSFEKIPWSSGEVWMELALKEYAAAEYSIINASKLLAVPYAFHSATAAEISNKRTQTNNSSNKKQPGVPSNNWSLQGNYNSDPTIDKLGNTDSVDLVLVTNNQDRLRIQGNGDIVIDNSLEIGEDLNVNKNVTLNILGGQTINNGNFSVTNQSVTLLTGTLTVNGATDLDNTLNVDGATDLNSSLDVNNMAPTHLTGTLDVDKTLNVDGATDLNSSLDVNNMAPTHLTGTLDVDKTLNVDEATTLQSTLDVNNMAATHLTGTLDVDQSLNVDGTTDLNSSLDVNNMAPTHLTGTLDVDKTLNVDGATTLQSTLDVNNMAATHLTGTLDVDKTLNVDEATTLNSTLDVTNMAATHLTGTLDVDKTLNVDEATTLNGTLNANGQVTINTPIAYGDASNYALYPLRVEGGAHGVAIKVNATGNNLNRNINFLTLFDGAGEAQGRIEGFRGLRVTASAVQDIIDDVEDNGPAFTDTTASTSGTPSLSAQTPPQSANQNFNNDYAIAVISEFLDLANGIVKVTTNSIACAAGIGIFGDCDDVFWSVVDAVVQGIQVGGLIAYNELNLGATFESGGADYAEWLQKENANESLNFGEVVGVRGGKISKSFLDAEKFMVVSYNPTIVGAMPAEGTEELYERIAFMGQVPVKVIGKVNLSDYILPSGNGDGMAVAVSPDMMLARDYSRIIGVAWSSSDGLELFSYINTAVGLNTNDMALLVENMQLVMNEMQKAISEVNPNFSPTYFDVEGEISTTGKDYTKSASLREILIEKMNVDPSMEKEKAFTKVKEYASENSFNLSEYPYFSEILQNPDDMDLMIKARDHYTKVSKKLNKLMQESTTVQQSIQAE